jgi:hypothetical protein
MGEKSQERRIVDLEKMHILYDSGKTYIALEECEFRWTMDQVKKLEELWNEGLSLEYIADYFGRTQLETGLLIADRAVQGILKPRKHGIFGGLVV